MKIGFVTPVFPPGLSGGGGASLRLLAENLMERGHDVEILSFDSYEKDGGYDYVERHIIESGRIDLTNLKARKKVKEFSKDKDILHGYNMNLNPVVGTIRDTKTVATLNDYYFFYPYKVKGNEKNPRSRVYRTAHDFVSRMLMRRIDQFITISTDAKKEYSRILPEEKIEIIPEMVDTEFGEPKEVETVENELLYVGRLEEKKGLEQLIRQMKEMPEYTLNIDGKGPEKEKLEELIAELELEERVNLNGYVDFEVLLEHYSRAEWFIHPGRWPEPFGRTILEAMQMRTPIIATNRGGPKDVLKKEQLIEKVEEIPEKIDTLDREKIISDQNKILPEYVPEKIMPKYEELYERVLDE